MFTTNSFKKFVQIINVVPSVSCMLNIDIKIIQQRTTSGTVFFASLVTTRKRIFAGRGI